MITTKLWQFTICLSFAMLTILSSCKKESSVPNPVTKNKLDSVGLPPPLIFWARGADLNFPDAIAGDVSVGRIFSQGFAINGKGYICAGNSMSSFGTTQVMFDLWEFDPNTHLWTQKANYPGSEPIEGVNFVIGDNAYICFQKELWQYNQPSNTWTRKADFPSTVIRTLSTALAINGNGYVGLGVYRLTGSPGFASNKDWWRYDPTVDEWNKMGDFPGGRRGSATGFAINGKGYVCSGSNWATSGPSGDYNDLWQYNPVLDTWKQKADFPGLARTYTVGMTVQDFGFVITGETSSGAASNEAWQYSPSSNTWYKFPNVGGGARMAASGFSIGNTLYIGQGATDILSFGYKKDFWGLSMPVQ